MSTKADLSKTLWQEPVLTTLTRNSLDDSVYALNVKNCDTTGSIHSCGPDPFPKPSPKPSPSPSSDLKSSLTVNYVKP